MTDFPHFTLDGKIGGMEPRKIGRYQIKSELGRGGMATVYHAYDPRFQREVALKVLPHEFLHDPTFRARFEREAQTIAALEHPVIVSVYDFGKDGDQPYLVMRLLSGGSLANRLKQGALPFDEVTRLINRLAPAIDEAHQQGIIHRDLKPDNILFDQRGEAFITDFGIVKLSEGNETLTSTRAIMGTPAYMSPEQAHGELELDGRSDIYTLGVMLFYMLTGQLPYQANTPIGLIMKHLTEAPPGILEIKPDLPPACEAVIAQAMAKERDERYPTATTLATALTESTNPKLAPLLSPLKSIDTPPAAKSHQAIPQPAAPGKKVEIICPKCGASNPEHLRLCSHCAQRLKIECFQCYTPNRIDATHCANCGENLVRSQAIRRGLQTARQHALKERGQAFRGKAARQFKEKIERLLKDLDHWKKRASAIRQLNQLDNQTLEILSEALLNDHDPNFRSDLAKTLGQFCDRPKVKPLIRARVVKALIKALDDAEPETRYRAAEALGKLKGQSGQLAVESLGALLKDSDAVVRQQAGRSLKKIGGKRAQELLASPKGFMGWIKGN